MEENKENQVSEMVKKAVGMKNAFVKTFSVGKAVLLNPWTYIVSLVLVLGLFALMAAVFVVLWTQNFVATFKPSISKTGLTGYSAGSFYGIPYDIDGFSYTTGILDSITGKPSSKFPIDYPISCPTDNVSFTAKNGKIYSVRQYLLDYAEAMNLPKNSEAELNLVLAKWRDLTNIVPVASTATKWADYFMANGADDYRAAQWAHEVIYKDPNVFLPSCKWNIVLSSDNTLRAKLSNVNFALMNELSAAEKTVPELKDTNILLVIDGSYQDQNDLINYELWHQDAMKPVRAIYWQIYKQGWSNTQRIYFWKTGCDAGSSTCSGSAYKIYDANARQGKMLVNSATGVLTNDIANFVGTDPNGIEFKGKTPEIVAFYEKVLKQSPTLTNMATDAVKTVVQEDLEEKQNTPTTDMLNYAGIGSSKKIKSDKLSNQKNLSTAYLDLSYFNDIPFGKDYRALYVNTSDFPWMDEDKAAALLDASRDAKNQTFSSTLDSSASDERAQFWANTRWFKMLNGKYLPLLEDGKVDPRFTYEWQDPSPRRCRSGNIPVTADELYSWHTESITCSCPGKKCVHTTNVSTPTKMIEKARVTYEKKLKYFEDKDLADTADRSYDGFPKRAEGKLSYYTVSYSTDLSSNVETVPQDNGYMSIVSIDDKSLFFRGTYLTVSGFGIEYDADNKMLSAKRDYDTGDILFPDFPVKFEMGMITELDKKEQNCDLKTGCTLKDYSVEYDGKKLESKFDGAVGTPTDFFSLRNNILWAIDKPGSDKFIALILERMKRHEDTNNMAEVDKKEKLTKILNDAYFWKESVVPTKDPNVIAQDASGWVATDERYVWTADGAFRKWYTFFATAGDVNGTNNENRNFGKWRDTGSGLAYDIALSPDSSRDSYALYDKVNPNAIFDTCQKFTELRDLVINKNVGQASKTAANQLAWRCRMKYLPVYKSETDDVGNSIRFNSDDLNAIWNDPVFENRGIPWFTDESDFITRVAYTQTKTALDLAFSAYSAKKWYSDANQAASRFASAVPEAMYVWLKEEYRGEQVPKEKLKEYNDANQDIAKSPAYFDLTRSFLNYGRKTASNSGKNDAANIPVNPNIYLGSFFQSINSNADKSVTVDGGDKTNFLENQFMKKKMDQSVAINTFQFTWNSMLRSFLKPFQKAIPWNGLIGSVNDGWKTVSLIQQSLILSPLYDRVSNWPMTEVYPKEGRVGYSAYSVPFSKKVQDTIASDGTFSQGLKNVYDAMSFYRRSMDAKSDPSKADDANCYEKYAKSLITTRDGSVPDKNICKNGLWDTKPYFWTDFERKTAEDIAFWRVEVGSIGSLFPGKGVSDATTIVLENRDLMTTMARLDKDSYDKAYVSTIISWVPMKKEDFDIMTARFPGNPVDYDSYQTFISSAFAGYKRFTWQFSEEGSNATPIYLYVPDSFDGWPILSIFHAMSWDKNGASTSGDASGSYLVLGKDGNETDTLSKFLKSIDDKKVVGIEKDAFVRQAYLISLLYNAGRLQKWAMDFTDEILSYSADESNLKSKTLDTMKNVWPLYYHYVDSRYLVPGTLRFKVEYGKSQDMSFSGNVWDAVGTMSPDDIARNMKNASDKSAIDAKLTAFRDGWCTKFGSQTENCQNYANYLLSLNLTEFKYEMEYLTVFQESRKIAQWYGGGSSWRAKDGGTYLYQKGVTLNNSVYGLVSGDPVSWPVMSQYTRNAGYVGQCTWFAQTMRDFKGVSGDGSDYGLSGQLRDFRQSSPFATKFDQLEPGDSIGIQRWCLKANGVPYGHVAVVVSKDPTTKIVRVAEGNVASERYGASGVFTVRYRDIDMNDGSKDGYARCMNGARKASAYPPKYK